MENYLDRLEAAEQMLAAIATATDAQRVINMAEVARVLAREAELGNNAINHATVIKLRAERKLADIVDAGQERGEIAGQGKPAGSNAERDVNVRTPDVYADLGITRQRLAEARRIRDNYTDSDLVSEGEAANSEGRTLSRDRLLRETRQPVEVEPEDAALVTAKEVLSACRIITQRDRYLVADFILTLSVEERAKIRQQLQITRTALIALEEEIGEG